MRVFPTEYFVSLKVFAVWPFSFFPSRYHWYFHVVPLVQVPTLAVSVLPTLAVASLRPCVHVNALPS